MKNNGPRVKLISYTKNPYVVLYLAFTECYSKDSTIEKIEFNNIPSIDEIKDKINTFMKYGHESPLEHVSFTFAIDNISRACSHQLVRHRIASYSQKSQRYVDTREFLKYFIISDSFNNDKNIYKDYIDKINIIFDLINDFKNKHKNIKSEDVRMLLPNATTTSLILTMNIRELLHFFNMRCCKRAQDEIRNLAYKMLHECKNILPEIFNNAGPLCKKYGICFEYPKFSCNPDISIYNIIEKLNLKEGGKNE